MLTIMDDLKARRFEFTLKLKNELFLPSYKGAVFRGALCNSLKRITCAFRDRRPCKNCTLGKSCVYANIFEPMPPEDFPDGAKFICATPPYVLNPPNTLKRRFLPGENISFDLVLIGKAVDLLPYLVFAVIEIGRLGLTQNRAKFSLENVRLVAGNEKIEIFDGESFHKTEMIDRITLEHENRSYPNETHISNLTIEFKSPLRLKKRGSLVTNLDFSLFFDRLIHRLNLLTSFYGNGLVKKSNQDKLTDQQSIDRLIDEANLIKTNAEQLKWFDWKRFSNRQKITMKFGGLKGIITFEGNLNQFIPYLQLGALINVGQGTSFGLGKYSIEKNKLIHDREI